MNNDKLSLISLSLATAATVAVLATDIEYLIIPRPNYVETLTGLDADTLSRYEAVSQSCAPLESSLEAMAAEEGVAIDFTTAFQEQGTKCALYAYDDYMISFDADMLQTSEKAEDYIDFHLKEYAAVRLCHHFENTVFPALAAQGIETSLRSDAYSSTMCSLQSSDAGNLSFWSFTHIFQSHFQDAAKLPNEDIEILSNVILDELTEDDRAKVGDMLPALLDTSPR